MASLGRRPSAFHPSPMKPLVHSFAKKSEINGPLAAFVFEVQKEAIAKKGKFTIAVSGGSLVDMLTDLIDLEVEGQKVSWEHWKIFYADERCVPLDHPDSNHKLCADKLYSKIEQNGLPMPTVYPIDASVFEDGDLKAHPENLTDDQCQALAVAYRESLISVFTPSGATAAYPTFDLILLGMGPDGHTASLFPGRTFLFPDWQLLGDDFTEEEKEEEKDAAWVGYIVDAPKPPPKRITLTYATLCHASHIAYVAAGGEKAEVLAKVLAQTDEVYKAVNSDAEEKALNAKAKKEFFPPSRIKPATGVVRWFVDDAAMAQTQYEKSPFKL